MLSITYSNIGNKFEVKTQFECYITYKSHNFQTSIAFFGNFKSFWHTMIIVFPSQYVQSFLLFHGKGLKLGYITWI
jgi:hypothetical protein